MQLRGRLFSVLRDVSGNVIISFNVGQKLPDVAYIEGKELDIKVVQHREKRSLTQNAYYWTLLSKLAGKQGISAARLHNLMLREMAAPEVMDGKIVMMPIPDTDNAENAALESSTFHMKPTSGIIVGKDNAVYRWYIVLRGSSTFNTQEMTVLLNNLVEACKEAGIETATPAELAQMRAYSEEIESRDKSTKKG